MCSNRLPLLSGNLKKYAEMLDGDFRPFCRIIEIPVLTAQEPEGISQIRHLVEFQLIPSSVKQAIAISSLQTKPDIRLEPRHPVAVSKPLLPPLQRCTDLHSLRKGDASMVHDLVMEMVDLVLG